MSPERSRRRAPWPTRLTPGRASRCSMRRSKPTPGTPCRLGSSALSLRLARSFVEKHRDAFAGLQGVVAPIGAGVGGRLMGEVVRLHALHLGDLSVQAPTAGLARERKGALEVGLFDGSIGTP